MTIQSLHFYRYQRIQVRVPSSLTFLVKSLIFLLTNIIFCLLLTTKKVHVAKKNIAKFLFLTHKRKLDLGSNIRTHS